MQYGKSAVRTGYACTTDGTRLFFEAVGDGPETVVVPNGMYLRDDFGLLCEEHTVIFYDLRNRGLSDAISDASKLKAGIHNDVDDLEAVRQHLGISKMTLVGHSYVGLMIALYAMKYVANVSRMVQLAPAPPYASKQYPAHLTCNDGVLQEVFGRLAELQKERGSHAPEEFCRKFWSVLRAIFVADPANAVKIDWGRCNLPNERNAMKYWNESVFPSMQALQLAVEDFAKITIPVLILHGRKDRSAPYGGAREWGRLFPNARLVSVDSVGHALWIEAPERVLGAMRIFLDGAWPEGSEDVKPVTSG
jgi:proline iminopeptidase